MQKFWNWARDGDQRILRFEGVISEDSWFGDEVTPAAFREELFAEEGNVTIFIHSPGGDCFAASQIYTMLMEYPHDVTVKIEALAASAASVVAMAGTRVLMSPTAIIMIHNPMSVAIGDSVEMQRTSQMLDEVKEAIMNAYEIRSGLPRAQISAMMDAETWLSAGKAVELGFADSILYKGTEAKTVPGAQANFLFSRAAANQAALSKLRPPGTKEKPNTGTPVADLDKRLALLH